MHLRDRTELAPDGQSLYKLTSRGPISDALLNSMFETVDEVTEVVRDAFPRLAPRAERPPFKLAAGLYYVNAMESVVSTMETEVISSRNVANLVATDRSE